VQADIFLVSQNPLAYQNQFSGRLSIDRGFIRCFSSGLARRYSCPPFLWWIVGLARRYFGGLP